MDDAANHPDWLHLKDYGYAPGGYMARCRDCGQVPTMDKRAWRCRPCAEAAYEKYYGQARREQEAEAALDAEQAPLLVAARKAIAGSQPLDSCRGGYVVPAELWLALQGEVLEQLREHARKAFATTGGPMDIDALLYEHEDGRHAVSFVNPAPFASGEPKWHRVGPVEVHGPAWQPMETAPKARGARFIGLTLSGRAVTAEPMYCVYDGPAQFGGWHEVERGSLVPKELKGWIPFPSGRA